MYNDSVSGKKALQQTITVGTSSVLSSSIDIKDFNQCMFFFRASTFAGTPDTADFVKIDKILASHTNAWAGEEVEFSSADAFVEPLANMSVANSTKIGINGLRAKIAGKYSYIKIGFISSDAANTVQLSVLLEAAKQEPVSH